MTKFADLRRQLADHIADEYEWRSFDWLEADKQTVLEALEKTHHLEDPEANTPEDRKNDA